MFGDPGGGSCGAQKCDTSCGWELQYGWCDADVTRQPVAEDSMLKTFLRYAGDNPPRTSVGATYSDNISLIIPHVTVEGSPETSFCL